MTLAELVLVRDAVIAAQANAVNVQHSLAHDHVATARRELGHVDDWLARAAEVLNEAIDKQRNESGS